jgi:small-conductance mechanosensitive channel
MFRGQEVGRIYAPYGPLSVEERAELATRRFNEIVGDYSIAPEELTLTHLATSSELSYGDRVIWVFTDEDARVRGVDRRASTTQALLRIRQVIVETRREFTRSEILKGLGAVVLLTALTALVLWALFRISRRLVVAIKRRRAAILPSLQKYELVSAHRLATALVRLVHLLQIALTLLAVVLWAEGTLASLPWTRPYARLMVGWLEAPVQFIGESILFFLPNLFYLLVISAFTYVILRLLHVVIDLIGRGRIPVAGFEPDWAEPTYKLIRALVVALAVVAAFPYIPGSDSPAFRGISLFLGFFVTLASSSAISNIIAGTILTYSGAFRIGDRVRIADTLGDVIRKTLLTTQVCTIKNVKVAIPNALVLGGQILNYTAMAGERGLILHTTVTIGYDTDWRRIHELLISAALATEGIVRDPAPFVLQSSLNDFHVSYELNGYTRHAQKMVEIYSDLHANIQDAFRRAGVEIMSPHYAALRDGNRATIGDDNLSDGYEPTAFRVRQIGPAADTRTDTSRRSTSVSTPSAAENRDAALSGDQPG